MLSNSLRSQASAYACREKVNSTSEVAAEAMPMSVDISTDMNPGFA